MRRHFVLLPLFALLILSAASGAAEPPREEEPIYQGKSLTEWIGDLKEPQEETHREAAKALLVFGLKKETVTALAASLKQNNRDEQFVLLAAQTLGKFGSKAREALPALRTALKECEKPRPDRPKSEEKISEDIPQILAEAIVLIDDKPGPELAPYLVKALNTKDLDRRRDIVMRLGKLGPDSAQTTVPALIAILTETEKCANQLMRRTGVSTTPWLGNDSEKIIPLRLEVVKSLGQLGVAAKPALHAVTLAMKIAAPDKSSSVMTAQVSDNPAGSPKSGVRTVSFTIVTGDEKMLRACAAALGHIHPDARGTVPALRLALRDLDEDVRWAALCALLSSGEDTKEVVPILQNILQDKDAALRSVAVKALGKSQGDAKDIMPALTTALKDKDAKVREAAAIALGEMGKKAKRSVPGLVAVLKDSNVDVRREAAEALGKINAADEETIAALLALLKDKEDSVVAAAARTLIRFGERTKAAIPVFLTGLQDPEPIRRGGYCFLLGSIGPAARDAIPALEKISREDGNQSIRLVALTALARIDSARLKDTVRRLTRSLESKNDELYEAAKECLLFLGPDARDALPTLRRLHEAEVIREWDYKRVIEAIENEGKPTMKRGGDSFIR